MRDQHPAGAEAVLADITAEGIEKAIAEFNRLGRARFLEKYGFKRAHRYFIDHQGKHYDSKAIVGAARGYDRPDLGPVPSSRFSGGRTRVQSLLEKLGFQVVVAPKSGRNPAWAEEELILALELYLNEGMLDDTDPLVIRLSSELNALEIHNERPDAHRFRNPNGVALKLANFVAIDPSVSRKGMSSTGKLDRAVWDRYANDEDALARAAARIREGLQVEPRPTGPVETRVISVAVEAQHKKTFDIEAGTKERTGERREQTLVLAFRDSLVAAGRTAVSHVYEVPEAGTLRCDLFDETENVLYEAKGNVRRHSIRMAIGQLLDYQRFEETHPDLGVLLPRRPQDDLLALLSDQGIRVVWRDGSDFETYGDRRS